ncbi:MAG: hypothetical protein KC777_17250 [Cyanobacteria bacterium HKST-UBA02]|nr:hypothetical protein [Cyanobacteria bacterium HKST-UBA02]
MLAKRAKDRDIPGVDALDPDQSVLVYPDADRAQRYRSKYGLLAAGALQASLVALFLSGLAPEPLRALPLLLSGLLGLVSIGSLIFYLIVRLDFGTIETEPILEITSEGLRFCFWSTELALVRWKLIRIAEVHSFFGIRYLAIIPHDTSMLYGLARSENTIRSIETIEAMGSRDDLKDFPQTPMMVPEQYLPFSLTALELASLINKRKVLSEARNEYGYQSPEAMR